MQTEKKEYVSLYVTEEDKKRIEAHKDNYALQMSIVKEMFQGERDWLKQEMKQMDDDLLNYRAILLRMRQAYKEAQTEHYTKCNELWDEISKGVPSFKTKMEKLVSELEPLTDALNKIKNQTDSVQVWKAKEIVEMVNLVSSMTPEKIAMFEMLVKSLPVPQS